MLGEVLAILRDFARAIRDHRHGRTRCRFENTVEINAAPEIIWQAIWSSGHLDGVLAADYRIAPLDDAPDHYQAAITVNEICHRRTFRICEDRHGMAVTADYVSQETDPPTGLRPHHFALVLEDIGDKTVLMHVEEVSLRDFSDHILYPLTARWVLRLLKSRCEFGPAERPQPDGGAALARSNFRSLLDNAFCARMEPAVFSLLPSALLFAAYYATGAAGIGVVAALFAMVNLLNLLPMPPFNGGNVVKAIFRSLTRQAVVMTGWALLVLGLAISVYQGVLIFGIGIAITAFLITDLRADTAEHTPMSKLGVLMILSGMILTGAIYGAILYITLQDAGVSRLIAAI